MVWIERWARYRNKQTEKIHRISFVARNMFREECWRSLGCTIRLYWSNVAASQEKFKLKRLILIVWLLKVNIVAVQIFLSSFNSCRWTLYTPSMFVHTVSQTSKKKITKSFGGIRLNKEKTNMQNGDIFFLFCAPSLHYRPEFVQIISKKFIVRRQRDIMA